MKIHFVWGAGGVGKSHLSVFVANKGLKENLKTTLMTLDPSRRVFELKGLPKNLNLKSIDAAGLFENLSQKIPTTSKVQNFYKKMVSGLREFRDYLALVQLSDELHQNNDDLIVVDTPPFEEAIGLHRAVKNLRSFFSTSLVQIALSATKFSILHFSFKKIFEISRFFVGKKAADTVLELITWLTQHRDRFEQSSVFLEKIFYSKDSLHSFVLSPESSSAILNEIKLQFKEAKNIRFYLNRSVFSFPENIFEKSDPFLHEMKALAEKEKILVAEIHKVFPEASLQRIPLLVMGDDTEEEMKRFLETEAINA